MVGFRTLTGLATLGVPLVVSAGIAMTPLSQASAQCEPRWLDLADFPGVDGEVLAQVNAVVAWDPDGAGPADEWLVVGGSIANAGDIVVQNIAAWDGQQWHALGDGFNDDVVSLAVFNGELYAGGVFSRTGTTTRHGFARWNGTAWENPGYSNPSGVRTICVHDGKLFVGSGGGLSMFDGHAWTSFGLAVPSVRSLASTANGLVVGGVFSAIGGIAAKNVARWDGATWHSLGAGLNLAPRCLTEHDGMIIAGGQFTMSGSVSIRLIGAWNGSEWVDLGSTLSGSSVDCVASVRGQLLMGGQMKSTDPNTPFSGLAKWDGWRWSAAFKASPAAYHVLAIAPWRDTWTVGGDFSETLSGARNVAIAGDDRFITTGKGLDDVASVFLPMKKGVYVGGEFRSAGESRASYIARWDGSAWHSLGGGVSASVADLVEFNGDLVVAGFFETIGHGISSPCVGRWTGDTWVPMGNGLGGAAMDLVVMGESLYVGGQFFEPDDEFFGPGVLRWTNDEWVNVGDNLFGQVSKLLVHQDQLVAIGSLSHVRGPRQFGAARFDGTEWHQLGVGVPYWFGAEAIDYMGTLLVSPPGSGGVLLRWDGMSWTTIGEFDERASSLAEFDGHLYVAGEFTEVDGKPLTSLAVWDGSSWQQGPTDEAWKPIAYGYGPLGMIGTDGRLLVGGGVLRAGGIGSRHFIAYSATGKPWIVVMPEDTSVVCGGGATLAINTASAIPVEGYQWERELTPGSGDFVAMSDGDTPWGSVVFGAGTQLLSITNTQSGDAGLYRCVSTNSCGGSASLAAKLEVTGMECCVADYNGDLALDILDFLDFFDDFSTCEGAVGPCGSFGNADMNGDTVIDILDFLDFFEAFSAGC